MVGGGGGFNYNQLQIDDSSELGSEVIIDVTNHDCGIPDGFQFINNKRVRDLVTSNFNQRQTYGVIYITKQALYYLVKHYGIQFIALPIAIKDFGITSYLKLVRKSLAVVLVFGGANLVWTSIFYVVLCLIIGGIIASYNFNNVSTTLVGPTLNPNGYIERRIPDVPDVGSVQLTETQKIQPQRSKLEN